MTGPTETVVDAPPTPASANTNRSERSVQAKRTQQQQMKALQAASTAFTTSHNDMPTADMAARGWFTTSPVNSFWAYSNGIMLLSKKHPLAVSHGATHWCCVQLESNCPVTGDLHSNLLLIVMCVLVVLCVLYIVVCVLIVVCA
jgi:hypothetical protein